MGKEISHPVTNGSTKRMIWLSLIFLFAITVLSLVFIFIGIHTVNVGFAETIIFKSILGTVATTCSSGIIYSVHSFFETRTKAQKDGDKLKLKIAKYDHREEMYRIKKGLDSHKKKNKD